MSEPQEQRKAVQPYRVTLMCECGGDYEATGEVLTSYPPYYRHMCNYCGAISDRREKYPYIAYKEL